jgi:hypothetical protein
VTPTVGGGDEGAGASRGTPVIPAQRDKPVGLDMDAFLPPNAADFADARSGAGDAEVLEAIETGHASMIRVLAARLRNTQIVRARWEGGDPRAAVDTLISLADQVHTTYFRLIGAAASLLCPLAVHPLHHALHVARPQIIALTLHSEHPLAA